MHNATPVQDVLDSHTLQADRNKPVFDTKPTMRLAREFMRCSRLHPYTRSPPVYYTTMYYITVRDKRSYPPSGRDASKLEARGQQDSSVYCAYHQAGLY